MLAVSVMEVTQCAGFPMWRLKRTAGTKVACRKPERTSTVSANQYTCPVGVATHFKWPRVYEVLMATITLAMLVVMWYYNAKRARSVECSCPQS